MAKQPLNPRQSLLTEEEYYDVNQVSQMTGRNRQLILRWVRKDKVKAEKGSAWPYPVLFSPTAVVAIMRMPKRNLTRDPLSRIPRSLLEQRAKVEAKAEATPPKKRNRSKKAEAAA